jgi:hypothetical protein
MIVCDAVPLAPKSPPVAGDGSGVAVTFIPWTKGAASAPANAEVQSAS